MDNTTYGQWTRTDEPGLAVRRGPEGLICLSTPDGECATLRNLLESIATGRADGQGKLQGLTSRQAKSALQALQLA
ncbi:MULTISPECIES: hypothetical protein [Streptomyces]|uniref:DUF397 domain-containing protein n=1 Tax=Streptomyces lycii TaxID=2654337 RepID=A0ABQ7FFT4_9ACTN|nr:MULTISPECIES: hypothetical protein [Streptomyces]KAF4407861.1 hypothetical protein GCU69_17355 [Streptomyces lycii]